MTAGLAAWEVATGTTMRAVLDILGGEWSGEQGLTEPLVRLFDGLRERCHERHPRRLLRLLLSADGLIPCRFLGEWGSGLAASRVSLAWTFLCLQSPKV